MFSYKVLTDELPISPKAKHLLINLIEWVSENEYSHFVFTTEKREKKLQLSSDEAGVYVKNNYHTELTELIASGILKETDTLRDINNKAYSIELDLEETQGDRPPFETMAIQLLVFENKKKASLLGIEPNKLDDVENFRVVAKGMPQKKSAGLLRFMRPQQITFATILCLANEDGVVRIEQGRLAAKVGINTKTLRNHLKQFHKLGLLSQQIGGFAGDRLLARAQSVFILKTELVIDNYQSHRYATKLRLINNPVREVIRGLVEISNLGSVSDRLQAFTIIAKERSSKLSIPKALIENNLRLLTRTFKAVAPRGERPHKSLCLSIEKIVINELGRSGFNDLGSSQECESKSKEEKEKEAAEIQERRLERYNRLYVAISEALIGPIFSKVENETGVDLKSNVATFLTSIALELFNEIQSAALPPNKDAILDGAKLRQKKFLLHAPAGKFFSSPHQLVILDYIAP